MVWAGTSIWHSSVPSAFSKIDLATGHIGQPMVVAGARSALFPFSQLSLIVIDEEHDGGYKQEEQGQARDMAIVRAKIHGTRHFGQRYPFSGELGSCRLWGYQTTVRG